MKKWRAAAALASRVAWPLGRTVEQILSRTGNPRSYGDSCIVDCEREIGNSGYQVHLLFAASEGLRHFDGQQPELLRRRYNTRRRTSTRVYTGRAMLESKRASRLRREGALQCLRQSDH
jgi:hypothetical protein